MIKNLKIVREQMKVNQKKVADDLKINTVTYNGWENGKAEPSVENLSRLADYFGVSIDYLVGREFANDLGFLTKEQFETVNGYLKLTEDNQKKVAGYVSALGDKQE